MNPLIYIIISTFLISLGSLIGIITIVIHEKKLEKILLLFVSLSAGGLMGGAFFHLLPEAAEKIEASTLFEIVLISFVLFFLIEKLLHWRHCHKDHCKIHTFGYMNLIGDAVHNFVDGLILAAAFVTSPQLGITTALAVALHEIPQEIGDFGVLLYSGFKKGKALVLNFLVAAIAIVGGVLGYYLSFKIENFVSLLLPFAAGGFIYIAASDLMPEIRKEKSLEKSLMSFLIFLLGIFIMFSIKYFLHKH